MNYSILHARLSKSRRPLFLKFWLSLMALVLMSWSGEVKGQYVVDFEGAGETKTGYASGTVNLSGLDWNMTEALIGTADVDFKNGIRSARMQGYGTSSMSMLEDKSNGIGVISFKYRRYGTDTQVDWRVEYSTNAGGSWTQIGSNFTAPANDNIQTFTETVNISGNVRIRIKRATESGTSNRRLNIDDITLTDYIPSTPLITVSSSSMSGFTYIEDEGPSTPQSFTVSGSNLTEDISISAPTNYEISKTDNSGFTTSIVLPHIDGEVAETNIYVRLVLGLSQGTYNGEEISITSEDATERIVTLNGEVTPPPVYGLQISSFATDYVIDFDNTVDNVNNGQFAGTGFSPTPSVGQLNSNSFAMSGWSDGTLSYGETRTTGDFARGSSAGAVTTGGIYAFTVSTGNRALGFQPVNSDWAPGTLTLRTQNKTNEVISSVLLSYVVYVRNDQGRSNSFNFSYSLNDDTYSTVASLDLISEEIADASPGWKAYYRSVKISDLNIANDDYFYLRWSGADEGGSGSRDEFALDDITINVNPVINKSVAGTYYDFAIAESTVVELSPVANLTINSKLSNEGTLLLNSDATGTATLVNTGTISGSGTTTIQQYLPHARNWYVSSPLSAATVPGSGYTFYRRDEAAAGWPTVNSGTFTPGLGYIALPTVAGATLEFSGGQINTGDVSVSLTRSGSESVGFNLIGNPYPAHMTWTKAFTDANDELILSSIWYRTNAGTVNNSGQWTFPTFNALNGEGVPEGTTGVIPPMQAFWVNALQAGTLTLNSNLTRSHQENNPLKAPVAEEVQRLRLQVSNGISTDEILVYFNGVASNSFDAYDSPKMFNNNASVPEIYTRADNQRLVINGMNQHYPGMEMALGFITGQANSFTLRASQLQNFDADVRVVLIDKVANTEFDLTAGDAYSFTSDAVNTEDRFAIQFRSATGTTGNHHIHLLTGVDVFSANGAIIVKNNNEIAPNARMSVYNSVGQTIHTQSISSYQTTTTRSFDAGVYLVKVENGGRSVVLRTIVR